MTDMLKIRIPFEGFYNSSYDAMFDHWLELESYNLAEDGATESQIQEWNDKAFNGITWGDLRKTVAESYVEYFNDHVLNEGDTHYDLGLKFISLYSPREYNFATDEIDCLIPAKSVVHMFSVTNREKLKAVMIERHTSRSGFISSYSNDLADWPEDPTAWDEIQLETLLRAYVMDECGYADSPAMWEALAAHNLMESYDSNGDLHNAIWGAASDEFKTYDSALRESLDKAA